jgi:hypothetical protein
MTQKLTCEPGDTCDTHGVIRSTKVEVRVLDRDATETTPIGSVQVTLTLKQSSSSPVSVRPMTQLTAREGVAIFDNVREGDYVLEVAASDANQGTSRTTALDVTVVSIEGESQIFSLPLDRGPSVPPKIDFIPMPLDIPIPGPSAGDPPYGPTDITGSTPATQHLDLALFDNAARSKTANPDEFVEDADQ